jgi:hypothetical protein
MRGNPRSCLKFAAILANWKGVLGSIGGALIVILQIINLLTTDDIESTLTHKTDILQNKADQLSTLTVLNTQPIANTANTVQSNLQSSLNDGKRMEQLLQTIANLKQEVSTLEAEEANKK